MQFNLSQWALKQRSFTIYCMIALVLAGTMSYLRLGRNEDPAFTFRTMVVFAAWPGADLNETLKQVTERLERTLYHRRCHRPIRSCLDVITCATSTASLNSQLGPEADVPVFSRSHARRGGF